MSNLTLNELASDAERQFQSAFGAGFGVASREVVGESYYRGGFRLVFVQASSEIVVSYGDLELAVAVNGRELFGSTLHEGFAGNMFSREHLKQYLPRVVASAAAQLQAAG